MTPMDFDPALGGIARGFRTPWVPTPVDSDPPTPADSDPDGD